MVNLFVLSVAISTVIAQEDLCRSCKCSTVNVLLHDNEPKLKTELYLGADRNWSPLSLLPDPWGKYLRIHCFGRFGSKWPPIDVIGVSGNFERIGLEKFPEFSPKVKRKFFQLSLAGNAIPEVSAGDTEDYQQLRVLDLRRNSIRHVEELSFSHMKHLLKLDLSGNLIQNVSKWGLTDVSLRFLNLADNSITTFTPESVRGLRNLLFLDLSNNLLSSLPDNFPLALPQLKYLYLKENRFEVIPRLPRSLLLLNISSNSLHSLVLPQTDDLLILDVSNNYLDDLDNVYEQRALKMLRVNSNRLSTFGDWKGSELRILDLSDNKLKVIPAGINSEKLPSLQQLYLCGNPIHDIAFVRGSKPFPNLDVLGLSRLGNITSISRESFTGILLESYINCSEESGVSLNLSNNTLTHIDVDTFRNFPICSLDLSHNRLTAIPENLLPWKNLNSIDLQNNPWNCICDLQWMLDTYLPHFYINLPQNLLELRCASPFRFKNRLFVYWYNASRNIFCEGPSYYRYEYSKGKFIEMWTTSMIASVILIVLIFVVLIAILIALFFKRGKKMNQKETRKKSTSKPLFSEVRIKPSHKYSDISQDYFA